LAAICQIIAIIILPFTFSSENNNILKLGNILNNKASVLESFLSDFWHGSRYFSEFSANSKIVN
jgi:hypothetical protein